MGPRAWTSGYRRPRAVSAGKNRVVRPPPPPLFSLPPSPPPPPPAGEFRPKAAAVAALRPAHVAPATGLHVALRDAGRGGGARSGPRYRAGSRMGGVGVCPAPGSPVAGPNAEASPQPSGLCQAPRWLPWPQANALAPLLPPHPPRWRNPPGGGVGVSLSPAPHPTPGRGGLAPP